jgi:ABC-type lipoprotein release transport system permease subunit
VHGLVTSVRRRRRDLAILKTLGMRRRDVSWVVAWQASTVALLALVIGVPIGILAGNVAWSAFSDQLGTVTETAVSLAALLVLVPAVVLVVNLAAAIPGRMAAGTPAALTLRSE